MNKYFVRYVSSTSSDCGSTHSECSTIVNIPDEDMDDLDMETFEIAIKKTFGWGTHISDILIINKL